MLYEPDYVPAPISYYPDPYPILLVSDGAPSSPAR